MEENLKKGVDDDEISLIDLLVVLLKYRRLIIVISLCGVLVAGVFYGVELYEIHNAPAAAKSADEYYESRMTVTLNPRLAGEDGLLSAEWFNTPEFIYTALREAGHIELNLNALKIPAKKDTAIISLTDESAKDEALNIIAYRFIQNQNPAGVAMKNDDVVYQAQIIAGNIRVLYRCGDCSLEQAALFMKSLYDTVELSARKFYVQYAEDIIAWYNAAGAIAEDAVAAGVIAAHVNRRADRYMAYVWAEDFLAGNDTVFKLIYPQTTAGVRKNPSSPIGLPKLMSIVIVFAAFFFAVFLAFVLNAIKNVSANEESMSKIREALGKDG
ncbi:hypothetical protein AGMMS49928_18690 [Spirochaetia bacterium]|nr:hypothetical protein AGMMS49928_18690 [Spirochaetia bacterium]